ncbi:MAG: hypothetical protein ACRD8A_00160 [Candidatus Acidiferrales bacterium]
MEFERRSGAQLTAKHFRMRLYSDEHFFNGRQHSLQVHSNAHLRLGCNLLPRQNYSLPIPRFMAAVRFKS